MGERATKEVRKYMIHKHPLRPRRQGRIFPEFTIPPEELARREAEMIVQK